jgi:hypothetical protein
MRHVDFQSLTLYRISFKTGYVPNCPVSREKPFFVYPIFPGSGLGKWKWKSGTAPPLCGYMDDTKASLLATRPGVGTSGVFPGLKSKFREKIPNAINVASKIENVKVVKLKEVLRLLLEAEIDLDAAEQDYLKRRFANWKGEVNYDEIIDALDIRSPDTHTDPEQFSDKLPQPYRMIHKLIETEILDNVWQEIVRINPELALGSDGKPHTIRPNRNLAVTCEPSNAVLNKRSNICSMRGSKGEYVFAMTTDGMLQVLSADNGEIACSLAAFPSIAADSEQSITDFNINAVTSFNLDHPMSRLSLVARTRQWVEAEPDTSGGKKAAPKKGAPVEDELLPMEIKTSVNVAIVDIKVDMSAPPNANVSEIVEMALVSQLTMTDVLSKAAIDYAIRQEERAAAEGGGPKEKPVNVHDPWSYDKMPEHPPPKASIPDTVETDLARDGQLLLVRQKLLGIQLYMLPPMTDAAFVREKRLHGIVEGTNEGEPDPASGEGDENPGAAMTAEQLQVPELDTPCMFLKPELLTDPQDTDKELELDPPPMPQAEVHSAYLVTLDWKEPGRPTIFSRVPPTEDDASRAGTAAAQSRRNSRASERSEAGTGAGGGLSRQLSMGSVAGSDAVEAWDGRLKGAEGLEHDPEPGTERFNPKNVALAVWMSNHYKHVVFHFRRRPDEPFEEPEEENPKAKGGKGSKGGKGGKADKDAFADEAPLSKNPPEFMLMYTVLSRPETTNEVSATAVDPGRSHAAIACADGTVTLWDLKQNIESHPVCEHEVAITSLLFCSNDCIDQPRRAGDMGTRSCLAEMREEIKNPLHFLVVGAADGTMTFHAVVPPRVLEQKKGKYGGGLYTELHSDADAKTMQYFHNLRTEYLGFRHDFTAPIVELRALSSKAMVVAQSGDGCLAVYDAQAQALLGSLRVNIGLAARAQRYTVAMAQNILPGEPSLPPGGALKEKGPPPPFRPWLPAQTPEEAAEEAEKAREAALALMAYDPQALPPPAPPFKRHQVTNNPYGKYCSEPDAYIPLRKLAFCCQGSDDGIAVLFWEVPPASPDEGEGEGEGEAEGGVGNTQPKKFGKPVLCCFSLDKLIKEFCPGVCLVSSDPVWESTPLAVLYTALAPTDRTNEEINANVLQDRTIAARQAAARGLEGTGAAAGAGGDKKRKGSSSSSAASSSSSRSSHTTARGSSSSRVGSSASDRSVQLTAAALEAHEELMQPLRTYRATPTHLFVRETLQDAHELVLMDCIKYRETWGTGEARERKMEELFAEIMDLLPDEKK